MLIEVSEKDTSIIQQLIDSGEFATPQEAVSVALGRMVDPLAGMSAARLNELIDEGVRDLDAGNIVSAEEMDRRHESLRATFLAKRSAK